MSSTNQVAPSCCLRATKTAGDGPPPAEKTPIDQLDWPIGVCKQTLGGRGGQTATGHCGQVGGCASRSGDPTPNGVAGGDDRGDEHGKRGEREHAGDGQVGRDDRSHG